ncbi:KEOPS complex subunit Cgi121 [Natrialba swarupiae]|uniref:KEOPS complex component n=1 Tax=Natrialba swarupiae TaxID=2448032 RepID=A0A5D5ARQ5_9EURY|nr:KEOPS complex subunit Cgi121 [Natrialba swarupiae]TYT63687.1 KEOPS complex component [Natrialba swarupiae]
MKLLECCLAIDDLDPFVADLAELGDRFDVTIQAFDARYVADRRHLERAVELADRSIDRGENVARDRAVEILLYAAGRRQIDRALEMGVSEGVNPAVVLIDALPVEPDERHGEITDRASADRADAEARALEAVRDLEAVVATERTLDDRDESRLCAFFDVTDAEREATDASLPMLVHERVTLLEVEK